ncbi:MAG: hypothetical protein ACRCVX_15495 [Shewanella sp.]
MSTWDDFDNEFFKKTPQNSGSWDDFEKSFSQQTKPQSQQPSRKDAFKSTASEMGRGEKFIAGVGASVDNTIRGVKQAFTNDPEKKRQLQEEELEARQAQAALGGWGTGGKILGSVAQMAPAAFIPGANTVAGAGLVGTLAGAAEPTIEGESRLKNAALGGALGGASQWGLGKLGDAAIKRMDNLKALKAANAGRDQNLANFTKEGYKIPRSELGGGTINNWLEGMAGKAALRQEMSVANQGVTNRLARESIGAPDTMPSTLRSLREGVQTTAPYQRLDSAGDILFTPEYSQTLKNIANNYGGQNSRLTSLKNPDVMKMTQELDFASASGKEINELIKNLREVGNKNKSAAYGTSPQNRELGKAQIEATKALEKLVDDNAGINPALQGLIPELQAARQRIAQIHTVENAANPATGEVSAKYFGRQFAKGKPLDGKQKTIAEFDQAFPKFSGEASKTQAPGVSALNATAAPMLGLMGSAASGSPAGMIAGGLPLLRDPMRKMLSSGWYQRGAKPSYDVGLFGSLPYSNPASLFLGRSSAPVLGLEFGNE